MFLFFIYVTLLALPLRAALSSKLRVLLSSYYGLCLKYRLKHCNPGLISFYGCDFGTCVVILCA